MAIASIWKDYFVSIGTASPLPFRIKVDGAVIYSGKSFKRPGETENYIKINDICADFLQNVLPTLDPSTFTRMGTPTFVVESFYSNSWHQKDSVQFINDWSYDRSYNPETMGMSFPINGRIDSRQWLTFTAVNASMLTATITLTDGSSFPVYIPVEISNDFNADYNLDFARSVRSAGSGTAIFDLSEFAEYGDVAKVTIDGRTWEVVTDCKEWVLYYVNAYGGWDSLLIEGNTSERDELTRHTMEVDYDNNLINNRGTHNFLNEISKTYTLNTSWLSDDESARMHHLLNSTEVYLYNINSGDMIPVVLNNTTTEHKTYKSNGNKLVNYSIEVTVAHNMIRR